MPYIYDNLKQEMRLTFHRAQVSSECIIACRKGGYKIIRDKQKHCTKVVLDPWAEAKAA